MGFQSSDLTAFVRGSDGETLHPASLEHKNLLSIPLYPRTDFTVRPCKGNLPDVRSLVTTFHAEHCKGKEK